MSNLSKDLEKDMRDMIESISAIKGEGYAAVVCSVFSIMNICRHTESADAVFTLIQQLFGGLEQGGYVPQAVVIEMSNSLQGLEKKQCQYMFRAAEQKKEGDD